MVFKRLLGALGVGGPTVDTVLTPGPVMPGSTLTGQVEIEGGSGEVEIEHVTLELVARVEVEHADGEGEGVVAFERYTVGGGFRLGAGERRSLPFGVTLPWETPVTELHGQPLGIVLGVRTELAVAGARDKGDLDPLRVAALPVQEAILEAFGRLGFGFRSADLEYGRVGGTGQRLPFYQEIEIAPSPQFAHQVNEIEVTFLAHPGGVEVVLEADKRGGFLSPGHDALTHVTVGHDDVRDWTAEVDGWVRRLVEHRASYGAHGGFGPGGHGSGGYGHGGHGHGGYGHGGHGHGEQAYEGHAGHAGHADHRQGSGSPGPGMGAAVAAGAAGLAVGVAGGMVAAEVVDEVGDFFEGDEEDGEEA